MKSAFTPPAETCSHHTSVYEYGFPIHFWGYLVRGKACSDWAGRLLHCMWGSFSGDDLCHLVDRHWEEQLVRKEGTWQLSSGPPGLTLGPFRAGKQTCAVCENGWRWWRRKVYHRLPSSPEHWSGTTPSLSSGKICCFENNCLETAVMPTMLLQF